MIRLFVVDNDVLLICVCLFCLFVHSVALYCYWFMIGFGLFMVVVFFVLVCYCTARDEKHYPERCPLLKPA